MLCSDVRIGSLDIILGWISISCDIDIEIECQYFLFGCVRYSDLDKILSLNVKWCLDVIKAVFIVIFIRKCTEEPHIMVQTAARQIHNYSIDKLVTIVYKLQLYEIMNICYFILYM